MRKESVQSINDYIQQIIPPRKKLLSVADHLNNSFIYVVVEAKVPIPTRLSDYTEEEYVIYWSQFGSLEKEEHVIDWSHLVH